MRDYLNFKIKGREWFRPLAPAVLWEHCREYFEAEMESPFMLSVAPVKPEKLRQIPAVTHVDGTARLQTVTAQDNPLFYELIKNFHEETGVPLVLNTSFNIRGFPIVETPSDAIWSFLNCPIDFLAIGPYLVSRELYSDDNLKIYRPQKIVKVDRDDSAQGKSFIYQPSEQKIRVLSAWEKKLLELCDGNATVEQIAHRLKGKEKKLLETLRGFVREQLVYLLPPHQTLSMNRQQ
jgi:Predicted carbamoyl transferase, NodU family